MPNLLLLSISTVFFLSTITPLASAHNVLQLEISKPRPSVQQRRKWARDTVTQPIANMVSLYTANVSVGTPAQNLQLQIDTGSTDIWMVSSAASVCQESTDSCAGGVFTSPQSSTFTDVQTGGFQIQYEDQTYAQGDFFRDVLRIGPSNSQTSVNNQQMALALDTDIPVGILGLGFALDESQCSLSSGISSCPTYPTLVQNLVSQKTINTQAYSLWLNDLSANTGSILFGGVDTAKFSGELVTLPIARDAQTGEYTSFSIAWTGLTYNSPQGQQGGFVPANFAMPAVLDAGTTNTLVPEDVAQAVYTQLNAQFISSNLPYVAPCSLGNTSATFDFEFGGAQRTVIKVPISELLLDIFSDAPTLDNGEVACAVGIEAAGDRPILFGDTFLRSAYVVYDLDKRQLSLAQTIFNSAESDIQEITATQGLPKGSSPASVESVVQTATGNIGPVLPSSISRRSSTTLLLGGGVGGSTSSSGTPAQYTVPTINNPSPIGVVPTSAASAPFVALSLTPTLLVPSTLPPLPVSIPITSSALVVPVTSSALTAPSNPIPSFEPPVASTPAAFTGAAAHLAATHYSFPMLGGGLWAIVAVTIFITLGGGLILL